jgi:NAD(P)-dependent dehydrogenase (short-subunit alcohol dehydrogenase family)
MADHAPVPAARPRSILITGCSSGIGANAALGLRARGWRVFASCRKEEDCERLRHEGFESPRLDYTDAASIEGALAEVLAATGGTLDALFNNGAFACPGAVEDLPTEALREIFETNLFGWHELTRRVIPSCGGREVGGSSTARRSWALWGRAGAGPMWPPSSLSKGSPRCCGSRCRGRASMSS